MVIFYLVISFVICQRLIELIIARQNEKWMKERGGVEFGKTHYKWFIFVHVLFFIVLIVEVEWLKLEHSIQLNHLIFVLFLLTQIGRIWCMHALGRFWNTKVIVLPKVIRIKKGPYKYVKHPNYIIVFFELLLLPFMFGAYLTAITFPMIHLLLMMIRIPVEAKALRGELTEKLEEN